MKTSVILVILIFFAIPMIASADKESDKSRLEDCYSDYRELMHDASIAAQDSDPPGNLASPKSRDAYNKAERKKVRCLEIQNSYEKKYGVYKK